MTWFSTERSPFSLSRWKSGTAFGSVCCCKAGIADTAHQDCVPRLPQIVWGSVWGSRAKYFPPLTLWLVSESRSCSIKILLLPVRRCAGHPVGGRQAGFVFFHWKHFLHTGTKQNTFLFLFHFTGNRQDSAHLLNLKSGLLTICMLPSRRVNSPLRTVGHLRTKWVRKGGKTSKCSHGFIHDNGFHYYIISPALYPSSTKQAIMSQISVVIAPPLWQTQQRNGVGESWESFPNIAD